MKRKGVVILGATGSIGESALKVAHDIPERMEIVGLAANSNAKNWPQQANAVRPEAVCLVDETKVDESAQALDLQARDFFGRERLARDRPSRRMPTWCWWQSSARVVCGRRWRRLKPGKDLAVASKEILVMAGEIVMREAREKGIQVLAGG